MRAAVFWVPARAPCRVQRWRRTLLVPAICSGRCCDVERRLAPWSIANPKYGVTRSARRASPFEALSSSCSVLFAGSAAFAANDEPALQQRIVHRETRETRLTANVSPDASRRLWGSGASAVPRSPTAPNLARARHQLRSTWRHRTPTRAVVHRKPKCGVTRSAQRAPSLESLSSPYSIFRSACEAAFAAYDECASQPHRRHPTNAPRRTPIGLQEGGKGPD